MGVRCRVNDGVIASSLTWKSESDREDKGLTEYTADACNSKSITSEKETKEGYKQTGQDRKSAT